MCVYIYIYTLPPQPLHSFLNNNNQKPKTPSLNLKIHFFFLSHIPFCSKVKNPSSDTRKAKVKGKKMSGVWMFKNNGVYRLVENPQAEGSDGRQGKGSSSKRKVLVHLPSGEVVSSYAFLEQILTGLGWERYYDGDPDLYQFHKHSSIDLISLPKDFSKFNSINMYDIVIKNPNVFHVRDK